MSHERWEELRIARSDAQWQSYHEQSKSNRFKRPLAGQALIDWQLSLLPSLRYEGHPAVALPAPRPAFSKSLEGALLERRTAAALRRERLPLETIATLLYYSYGVTRPNPQGGFPHGFRAVPSGGALYPLEVYVHTACVDGLPAGIYHYEPAESLLRRFVDGDQTERIAASFAQPELAMQASAIFFFTALFERTATKYGERGYRFALLEAGHAGQNLALVATALELGIASIGGYVDHYVDELLEIDGINQSALYLFALGGTA